MNLIIDATPATLDSLDTSSFSGFCTSVNQHLTEKGRAISLCKINGQPVHDLALADQIFSTAQTIEFETIDLKEAVASVISTHCNQLRTIEQDCETLVTDALLAEPQEIADQWTNICEGLKKQIDLIPHLTPFLTEEQVDELVDKHFAELHEIMSSIAEILNEKGDVVAFSDALEMRLMPWIGKIRNISESTLKLVESAQNQ